MYYGQVLIHEDREHEAGVPVVSLAIEEADCFEEEWSFDFTEAGFKHLDSGGAIVPVDSGQSFNPVLERYGSGLVGIPAFLIQGIGVLLPDIEN